MRDLDSEIAHAVEAAIGVLKRSGARVTDVKIPEIEGNPDSAGVITLAEAIAFYHPRIEKQPGGVGPKVLERLKRAYQITARDLVLAERHQITVMEALDEAFEDVHFLAGATVPAFPPVIGTGEVEIGGRKEPVLREFPRLTSLANFAGIPAVSLPCGFGRAGLPIGLQLVGPAGADEKLLAVGMAFQRVTDWHRRWPPE